MKKLLYLFSIILFLFSACRKDDVEVIETEFPPQVGISYIFDVYGMVLNDAGEAVSGAIVTVDQKMTMSDDLGIFQIKGIKADQIGAYLHVESDGYFEGGKRIYPVKNSTLYTELKVIPHGTAYTFSANSGADYHEENVSLEFPPNSISLNGEAYNGEVNLFAYHLEADNSDLLDLMPGDLLAADLDDILVQLKSFGMLAVEMYSPNGQELNILEGNKVKMNLGIAAFQTAEAPAQIPMWFFDTELGFWKEEGSASRINDTYVTEVSHFTWWNCDIPNPRLQLCLTLLNAANQEALAFRSFKLKIVDGSGMISGITDGNGEACGWITPDVVFLLEVYDDCGDVMYTEEIGPLSDAINTHIAEVDVSGPFSASITGSLTDCGGSVLDSLLVIANYNGNFNTTISNENGEYEINIIACSDPGSIEISAYDLENLLSGGIELNLNNGDEVSEDIQICDDLEQFFQLTPNVGNEIIVTNCIARVMNDETLILASDEFGNIKELLGFTGFNSGSFTGNYFGENGNSEKDGINFTIESFGSIDGFITGTFEGTMEVGTVTISGSFIAKRIQ